MRTTPRGHRIQPESIPTTESDFSTPQPILSRPPSQPRSPRRSHPRFRNLEKIKKTIFSKFFRIFLRVTSGTLGHRRSLETTPKVMPCCQMSIPAPITHTWHRCATIIMKIVKKRKKSKFSNSSRMLLQVIRITQSDRRGLETTPKVML